MEEDRMRLRSEAEAPFRSLRLVLYGFSVVSASLATLISLPQLIGAVGGAPGALSIDTVLQNLAVNIGAITVRGWWVGGASQQPHLSRRAAQAVYGVWLLEGTSTGCQPYCCLVYQLWSCLVATMHVNYTCAVLQVFGLLFRSDWQARDKQLARLAREEKLASLQLQLANGKRLAVRDLQDSARCVVVAGTPRQVRSVGS
jgi:Low psii accumulation1 / Rep27